jgi:hypothetical protein
MSRDTRVVAMTCPKTVDEWSKDSRFHHQWNTWQQVFQLRADKSKTTWHPDNWMIYTLGLGVVISAVLIWFLIGSDFYETSNLKDTHSGRFEIVLDLTSILTVFLIVVPLFVYLFLMLKHSNTTFKYIWPDYEWKSGTQIGLYLFLALFGIFAIQSLKFQIRGLLPPFFWLISTVILSALVAYVMGKMSNVLQEVALRPRDSFKMEFDCAQALITEMAEKTPFLPVTALDKITQENLLKMWSDMAAKSRLEKRL